MKVKKEAAYVTVTEVAIPSDNYIDWRTMAKLEKRRTSAKTMPTPSGKQKTKVKRRKWILTTN